MKNKVFSVGIISLALAIVLFGCTTSGTYKGFITNPKTEDFEGSWRYMDVGVDMAYSFSGSDFILTDLLGKFQCFRSLFFHCQYHYIYSGR